MSGRAAAARWLALLLAAALPLPALAQAQAQTAPRNAFAFEVPVAPQPVATEGRRRLFYELHLRNQADEALVPVQVEVRDAADGRDLARFAGAGLAARLATMEGEAAAGPMALAPGAEAVVYVELSLPPERVPAALSHAVTYRDASAGAGVRTRTAVDPAGVAVAPATGQPLGAPLRGGPWAAVFHPDWERGHRRVFYTVDGRARIPGRFALDLVKLDAQGRLARGDADIPANAYAYGEDVLAVADATVVRVRNDYPEVARVSANGGHRGEDASGNFVVLDLGDGRHAFYEHLRPGSVRVAPGQRVQRGEVLGQVGFSGTANWPHLHFHVADAPSPLGAEGLPFAFERFRVLGGYEDIAALGEAPWTADPAPALREAERPRDNAVLRFDAPSRN